MTCNTYLRRYVAGVIKIHTNQPLITFDTEKREHIAGIIWMNYTGRICNDSGEVLRYKACVRTAPDTVSTIVEISDSTRITVTIQNQGGNQ